MRSQRLPDHGVRLKLIVDEIVRPEAAAITGTSCGLKPWSSSSRPRLHHPDRARHADLVCGRRSSVSDAAAAGRRQRTIVQRMLTSINTFPLLAVIFFVFAGVLMARGGIAGGS
jgi:hypothetical protein